MPKARPTPQTTQEPAREAGDLRLRFDRGVRRAAVTVDAARGLASWDEATRTFEFVLATEAPCREYRWDERTWMCFEVDEILSMDGLVDVEGIRGAPILNSHWSYTLDNVLGVIEEARVEGGSLICRGRLSGREDIADIRQDVAEGILRNMSVGFQILAEDAPQVRGADEVPLVTVTSWRCCEASIVPVPADPNAQTRSQKDSRPMAARTATPPAGQRAAADDMSEEDKAAADAAAAKKKKDEEDAAAARAAETPDILTVAFEGMRSAFEAFGTALGQRGKAAPAAEATPAMAERKATPAAENEALIQGFRGMAADAGAKHAERFDLMVSSGSPIEELRSYAVSALRTSPVELGGRSGGGEQAEAPKLLSFHQVRAAKAAAAKR